MFRILNETDAESVLEMPGGIVLRKEGALLIWSAPVIILKAHGLTLWLGLWAQ